MAVDLQLRMEASAQEGCISCARHRSSCCGSTGAGGRMEKERGVCRRQQREKQLLGKGKEGGGMRERRTRSTTVSMSPRSGGTRSPSVSDFGEDTEELSGTQGRDRGQRSGMSGRDKEDDSRQRRRQHREEGCCTGRLSGMGKEEQGGGEEEQGGGKEEVGDIEEAASTVPEGADQGAAAALRRPSYRSRSNSVGSKSRSGSSSSSSSRAACCSCECGVIAGGTGACCCGGSKATEEANAASTAPAAVAPIAAEELAKRIAVDPASGSPHFVEVPTVCDACSYCEDVCSVAGCRECSEKRGRLSQRHSSSGSRADRDSPATRGPAFSSSSTSPSRSPSSFIGVSVCRPGGKKDGFEESLDDASTAPPSPTLLAAAALACKRSFTMCEVQRHRTTGNAWLVCGDQVYDVTRYLDAHPGGKRSILRRAGGLADCSEDMRFHTKAANKLWASMLIGTLVPCGGGGGGAASGGGNDRAVGKEPVCPKAGAESEPEPRPTPTRVLRKGKDRYYGYRMSKAATADPCVIC